MYPHRFFHLVGYGTDTDFLTYLPDQLGRFRWFLYVYGVALQVLHLRGDGVLRVHDVHNLHPSLVVALLPELVAYGCHDPVGQYAKVQVCQAGLVLLVEHGSQVQVCLHAAERGFHLLQDIIDCPDGRAVLPVKVRLQEISEEYSRLDNVSYEEDWNELVRLIDRTEADEQFASGLEGGARSTFRSGLLISRILPEIGITNPYIRAAAAAIDVIAAISGRSLELGPTAEEVAREENRREQARLKAEIQARRDLEYKCRDLK